MAHLMSRLAELRSHRVLVSLAVLASVFTSRAQLAQAAPPADNSARTVVSVATFYADLFQGRPMANGQRFDMYDPTTAASNSWPLGTRLRVRRIPGSPGDASLTPADR